MASVKTDRDQFNQVDAGKPGQCDERLTFYSMGRHMKRQSTNEGEYFDSR